MRLRHVDMCHIFHFFFTLNFRLQRCLLFFCEKSENTPPVQSLTLMAIQCVPMDQAISLVVFFWLQLSPTGRFLYFWVGMTGFFDTWRYPTGTSKLAVAVNLTVQAGRPFSSKILQYCSAASQASLCWMTMTS